MAQYPSSKHTEETSSPKKKKNKVVHNKVDQGMEMTSSSSNNDNTSKVTKVPTVEITQVHVDVPIPVPSSSSVLLSRAGQQPAETIQTHVHHFLEYNGGSLFNNNATTGLPRITTTISAPPIPCSVLNPWFLSNGIPNFSKTHHSSQSSNTILPSSSSSSSSSGDAKRKLDEQIQAVAPDGHPPPMLHMAKRARLPADSSSDGQGPVPASAAVTLVELQDEKRKQADLESLLVSVITGDGNNITSSQQPSSQSFHEQENSNPAKRRRHDP